jgi:hypothetical protein
MQDRVTSHWSALRKENFEVQSAQHRATSQRYALECGTL